MASTYTYSYTSDFGSNLHQKQFYEEVSADVGITPTLRGVDLTGDIVNISFESALSAGEQTTLNSLVAAHVAILSETIMISNSTIFTTTLTSYQTRDTLTTGYLSTGDYKIDWFYTFTSEDGIPDIRIIIDDVTIIHTNNTRLPVISGTLEYDKIGFHIQTLSEKQHTIKLQFRGKALASSTILNSCLFISPTR